MSTFSSATQRALGSRASMSRRLKFLSDLRLMFRQAHVNSTLDPARPLHGRTEPNAERNHRNIRVDQLSGKAVVRLDKVIGGETIREA